MFRILVTASMVSCATGVVAEEAAKPDLSADACAELTLRAAKSPLSPAEADRLVMCSFMNPDAFPWDGWEGLQTYQPPDAFDPNPFITPWPVEPGGLPS